MVQLKEFTWVQPSLGPRELLQAIESAIPVDAIETAIQQSHSQHQRERALPTPLVVALVILNVGTLSPSLPCSQFWEKGPRDEGCSVSEPTPSITRGYHHLTAKSF